MQTGVWAALVISTAAFAEGPAKQDEKTVQLQPAVEATAAVDEPAEVEAEPPADIPAADVPTADAEAEALASAELIGADGQGGAGFDPSADFETTQRLVGGAPLYNPNVRVHTVQRKRFADGGRHELVLFPVVPQFNGKFTQHYGTAASYVYHLYENFAFHVTPQYNWFANESDFNRELIAKVRSEAQAASSLLLQYGAVAGVEVTPFYGKFAFLDTSLAQFSLVLNGGAGLGETRHQLRPRTPNGPETFGDTGRKFLGQVGGGFRVQFGERFAIRAEVRDLIYTARVDQVNGCTTSDLESMYAAVSAGFSELRDQVQVSGGCQLEKFEGPAAEDVPRAYALVKTPSSDALNNVSFYAGFSLLF